MQLTIDFKDYQENFHEVLAYNEYDDGYYWVETNDAIRSRNGIDWLVKYPLDIINDITASKAV